MDHATGVLLAEKLSSLEDNEIPLSWLHSLESDGSNVNKIVWNKLDEQISALPERKSKGLVNISTFNLHVCYNAFQKVLQVFGEDLFELVISLYIWFKLSASRRENYEEVQRKLGLLTHKFFLALAFFWIVEWFDDFKQYFLVNVLAKQPSILHNKTYKKISDQIKCKDILAGIHFVAAVADIFNGFLVLFQKGRTINPYITLRMYVTSFDNNGKISKAGGICRVGCKKVTWYQNCML